MILAAHRQRRVAWAGILLLLAACGGGGGGGGSTDLSTAPGITVAPTSLSFAAVQNGALPATQHVSISISAPNAFFVGLAVLGGPIPAWLDLSQATLTSTSWTAGITATSLPVGTYTSTIAIGIADRNQNILAYRTVQVSYTVQPMTGLAGNPNGLTFNQLLGAAGPSSQTLTISEVGGASYAWNAAILYQSGSGWLNINGAGSASGATLPTTLTVSINPQVALGTLNATIRITGNNNTLDVPVSYTRSEPVLTRSPSSLSFSALRLGTAPSTQDIALSTTGSLPLNYTTSVTYNGGQSGWLSVPTSGTAPGTVTTGVNTTTLAPGGYTANVTFNTATQSVSVSVTYIVNEPTVTPSPSSLAFSALRLASAPATQDISLGTQSNVPVAFTTSVNYGSGASGWLNVPASGTAPTAITVGVNTTSLPPAIHSATLVISTPTKTLSVLVSYAVNEPTLTRSPSQLTFNAISGGTLPATQDITVSTQQSVSLDYSSLITYGAGASGWLSWTQSGPAPGTVTMGVNTTALAPATYTATLSINTTTQTVVVGISYVVAGSSITFSPGSASFTIDTTSVAAALSQSVGIGTTGLPLSWTASSSEPWVKVSPASGSTGTSVTLSLDPAQLDTLDAGKRSATVTFAYTPLNQAATNAPLAVSLDLQIPKIDSVNPYVATSSTSLEVIVRGSGFSNTGGAPLNLGSTPVSGYTVASDTELRVTHPLLTAGSYPLTFTNQLGNPDIVRSTATLVVVDAPLYDATTLAYPDVAAKQPLRVVYDAERKSLLVAVRPPTTAPAGGTLYRYTFSGSAWSAPATASVNNLRDLAMTLDGKRLIAARDANVTELDPVTLATKLSTDVFVGIDGEFFKDVAVANDGKAILSLGVNLGGFKVPFAYSILDASVTQFPLFNGLFNHRLGGSADGSRVMLPQSGISPPQPVYRYDASTSTLSATGLSLNSGIDLSSDSRPVLDRSASRILFGDSSVYNANLAFQGFVPLALTLALSPDGSKAYVYTSGTVLHTYDLNAPLVAGIFPEIESGTILPSDPGTVTAIGVTPIPAVMTVSPDGGTLFIAGKDGIVVMPAP